MPPATPTLTLARLSPSSFSASVSGGSASATHALYYREAGAALDTQAVSITGNGAFAPITGLVNHSTYVAWAVGLESGSYSLPSFAWVSLAAPGDLLGGIHARWYGDPALASLVAGGLWTGEVPEGTSYPYAWLEVPESVPMPNMVNQVESARAVFHVWAIGATAASACARAVKSRFDYRKLDTYDDAVCVSCTPLSLRVASEGLRDKSARLVFRASITYRLLTQRPR